MTTLSMRGLVTGTRGPGGGYSLAHAPEAISLLDIASSFQRLHEPECPLGRDHICGRGERCALHEPLYKLQENYRRFLAETTLAGFAPEGKVPDGVANAGEKRRSGKPVTVQTSGRKAT